MQFSERLDGLLPGVSGKLIEGWNFTGKGSAEASFRLGGQKAVQRVLHDIIAVVFPGFHGEDPIEGQEPQPYVRATLTEAVAMLRTQVQAALAFENGQKGSGKDPTTAADAVVLDFVEALPQIQQLLQADIVAAYEGDPAAKSTLEVVLSYPGLYAIAVHRVAHFLETKAVPLIPRIMTEWAHSQTGIDMHPGATIGSGFFIDHGTGVVIGETAFIGERVKLYQGVTLGALSFPKDEHGNPVKGIKRHPNVEDGVVIYAGATILGGDTTIGAHSVIGGNVWLTHSVPPYSKVYNRQPSPDINPGGKK